RKTSPRTLKRLLLAFSPYKGRAALVLLTIQITTALSLVTPLLIPRVFDDAIPGHKMKMLLVYALIMVAATVLSGLAGLAQTYLNNIVGQQVMRDFRNRLYAHLQDMSLRFFTATRTGEMQSRLSNDVSGAQTAVTDTLTALVSNASAVVGTVIAM